MWDGEGEEDMECLVKLDMCGNDLDLGSLPLALSIPAD